MDIINIAKQWVIDMIMNCLRTYFTSLSFENIQLELFRGSCSFNELNLNTSVLVQKFDLPFDIISGHVKNLNIEIPWYKMLTNVLVEFETIELNIRAKSSEDYQNNEQTIIEQDNDLKPTTNDESSVSYKEFYVNKLLAIILNNLSISCKTIIIKHTESNIVIQIDIKSFTITPTNDDWIMNYDSEESPNKWILKKIGDIIGFTMSMNKINNDGQIKQYLQPLVLNNQLSLRMCCIFTSPTPLIPYSIQIDMFSMKIKMTIMESHMLMITELLHSMKKSVNKNRNSDVSDDQLNNTHVSPTSISETISTEEKLMNWANSWLRNTINQTSANQQFNMGIYLETLKILLNFDVEDSFNNYKPFIKVTCNGITYNVVYNSFGSMKIKFGISKTVIKSTEDCTCGFNDCLNNQKLYFSSGRIQDDYLIESLFGVCTDTTEKKITSKRIPSIALRYNTYQRPVKKNMLTMEAGGCVIYISHGLIHRLQYLIKRIINQESSSFIALQTVLENRPNKYVGQDISYNFNMSNITIKLLPLCRGLSDFIRINIPKDSRCERYIENIPEGLIQIQELQGKISNEERLASTMTSNISVKNTRLQVYKSNTTNELLCVNKIEFIITKCGFNEINSDSVLNIDSINFNASKDNYLLFYYILKSMITKDQCNKLYINNCIFSSELLQDNLNSVVLKSKINHVAIRNIYQNRSQNFDITLQNLSVEALQLKKTNIMLWSKTLSTCNELEYANRPMMRIIVQIASDNKSTQMPLISIDIKGISLNIDPLFFKWFTYVPKSTLENRKTVLTSIDYEAQPTIELYSSTKSGTVENASKRFEILRWLNEWKSVPVFVDTSTISLYFPEETVSRSTIRACDENIDVKRWVQLLVDNNVSVVVMNMSRFMLKCTLENQRVESSPAEFPVIFTDPIWRNDKTLFPWDINLNQVKCYIMNKKYSANNEMIMFDTFSLNCSFKITNATEKNDDIPSTDLNGFLNCSVIEPINIYVSEQQVSAARGLLENIIDALGVFSNAECSTMSREMKSIMNAEDNTSNMDHMTAFKNSPEQIGNPVMLMESSMSSDNCIMENMSMNITLNDINVRFFTNEKDYQCVPLLYINLCQPKMLVSWTENSMNVYRMMLSNFTMYTGSDENETKTISPVANDYSTAFIETNINGDNYAIAPDLLTIEMSRNCTDILLLRPVVKVNLERNISISIHKTTIDRLKQSLKMISTIKLNQKYKYGEIQFKNKNVDNFSLNGHISENEILESNESSVDDIPYEKDVFDQANWIVDIKSQRLNVQLFTETKDTITLHVENMYTQLNRIRGIRSERTNGEMTMDNVSLRNCPSDDLLLHPTRIIIKMISYSSCTPLPIMNSTAELNVTTDCISFDVSQNHYEILLSMWNTYKYLFETKDNRIQNNAEELYCANKKYYYDDFGTNKFTIMNTKDSGIPLPYQIMISQSLSKQFEITWTYPQLRTLTKIIIESELIYPKNGLEVELHGYAQLNSHFQRYSTSDLCPKHKQIFPIFEHGKGISNTWRLIIGSKDFYFTNSKIKNLVICTKVNSYFAADFVPSLRLTMTNPLTEVCFLRDVQKCASPSRYKCISTDPIKQKLALIQLNELHTNCIFDKKQTIISSKGTVNSKLMVHGNLMGVSVVELPFNFISFHTTDPTRNNQFNIQTGAIECRIGPNIINSLAEVINCLFNRPGRDVVPYIIICNETYYSIIFGQANTAENIVLNSLECFNCTGRISAETPRLKLAIRNEDNELNWSEGISGLRRDQNKYLTIKDRNEHDTTLIVSVQSVSSITDIIVIASTLQIMNKTEYFLDSLITPAETRLEHPYSSTVNPYEITPSLTFDRNNTQTIALQFSTSEGPWSDTTYVVETEEKCTLIEIPEECENKKSGFGSVLCHVMTETVDEIPRMLILLLPAYMIRSYLSNDTMLYFSAMAKHNRTIQTNVIEVKSAVGMQKCIQQQIDLPTVSFDNDDDNDECDHLVLSLDESFPLSTVLEVSPRCLKTMNESTIAFSIDEHLKRHYASANKTANLKWPFIGNRFDHVQWRSGVALRHNTVNATLRIQNYGNIGRNGLSTRLISIWPRALMVNTTGQSITLHSSSDVLCTLTDMSVIAPPYSEKDNIFRIEINTDGGDGHCSGPLKFFGNRKSIKNRSIQSAADRSLHVQDVVFASSANTVAHLSARWLDYCGMTVIHLQSLYVATNCSSKDVNIMAVCSMDTGDILDVPTQPSNNRLYVNLPRNSGTRGKPLALWSLLRTGGPADVIRVDELDLHVILASDDRTSLPISLSGVYRVPRPVPAVFSSCKHRSPLCVALEKRRDNDCPQYVVTVDEQPHQLLALYNNFCVATTVSVADSPKCLEPLRFTHRWNWQCEVPSDGTASMLSFPSRQPKALYFAVETAGVPRTMTRGDNSGTSRRFASMTVNDERCTASVFREYKNKIEIKISKRAFTWYVIFRSTNKCHAMRAATVDETISPANPNNVLPSTSAYCNIQTFLLSLLNNNFNKKILTVTFHNVITTIQPIQNNNDEIKLEFSIDHLQISNRIFDNYKFDFPVVLSMEPHQSKTILPNRQQLMKYLSYETNQPSQTNSALTITCVLDQSSCSTPVILDLEVSLSEIELCIEDLYCYHLSNYLKTFKVIPSIAIEELDCVSEGLVPINMSTETLSNCITLRSLRITPFQLALDLHWSSICFISLNRSHISFTEFRQNDINISTRQLGQSALLHYSDNIISNTGNVMSSLELIGAPSNFMCLAKKGLHDLISMSTQPLTHGPKGLFFGVIKGIMSFNRHLSLGICMTVSSLTSSWSRTISNIGFPKCIQTAVTKTLDTVKRMSDFCIDYIAETILDNQ